MKKIVNFRPLFYCFLALFGAILFAKHIFLSNWVVIAVFFLILAAIVATCFLRKKLKILVAILAFIFLGLGLYGLEMSFFSQPKIPNDSMLYGRVENVSTYDEMQYIILTDVKINNEPLSKNVRLKLYGAPYLSDGDEILLEANFKNVSGLNEKGNVNSSLYKNGCYYTATKISRSDVKILGNTKTLDQKFRSAVKEKLLKHMSEENANITYAMLFGDKSGIDNETRNDFQLSGIAHILAVSGLHVGLVAGLLAWILKKCHAKNWLNLIITSAVLIFYCYLCGFSPSVVRATIMSICLLLANCLGRRYDSLSAIGFSGLVLLLVRPLYAFDIGFQLSFGCVIGIAIFYRSVYSFLRKPIKKFILPNWIAKPVSVSISSQFLILPVLINYFDGVSFLSLFANLIIIPIFTVAFTAAFIATPLVFIWSGFGNIFWFSNLLLTSIKTIASWVASQTWSIIPHFKFAFAAFVNFFALMFVSSRLFFARRKAKLLTSLILVCSTVLTIGLLQLA